MNVAPTAVRARSFDGWAEEYEQFRPGYPDALFDRIAERFDLPSDARAVDLGAGTGKVARHAARRGWRVTAVEPGDAMRTVLETAARNERVAVTVVDGTAEATELAAASFDVGVAGEAWHWFDPPRALAEIGRIVRPGGGLAFFWNVVDGERSPLVAAEDELVARHGIDGSDIRRPGPRAETREAIRAATGWNEPEFVQIPHSIPMTGTTYLGWARTKSHLRTAPADLQERFVADFEAMLTSQGVGPADPFEVPFIVDCWMTERSDR